MDEILVNKENHDMNDMTNDPRRSLPVSAASWNADR